MKNYKSAIRGLGYIGLPLDVKFGKKISTVRFDIDNQHIEHLLGDIDKTLEVSSQELKFLLNGNIIK